MVLMQFSVKTFSKKELPPSLYEELGICSLQSMANLYAQYLLLRRENIRQILICRKAKSLRFSSFRLFKLCIIKLESSQPSLGLILRFKLQAIILKDISLHICVLSLVRHTDKVDKGLNQGLKLEPKNQTQSSLSQV